MRTLTFASLAVLLAACGAPGGSGGIDFSGALDFAVTPPDLSPKPCAVDNDCRDPQSPRCDAASGMCVSCLPTADNCPVKDYCIKMNGVYQCLPGCKVDGDCAALAPDLGAGDGGAGASYACCGHVCTNVSIDTANCGKCGTACAPGGSCCSGGCSDTTKDVANCGACGTACASQNATWACTASKCAVTGCTGSNKDCNGNAGDGCEVDVSSDPKNCTACGMACSLPNAVAACMNGCAIQSCAAGYADCDKMVQNGCEVFLHGDLNNCGACGSVCAPQNAVPACAMGLCKVGACVQGFADCDKMAANGCEVNTLGDVANCGYCGSKCAALQNATPACLMGTCGVGACAMGFGDCDGLPGNGCEVSFTTDVTNCGGCGMICPAPVNGVAGCAMGACSVASCTGTYKDCNGLVGDGCEVDSKSDPNNCGACGMKCAGFPNAMPACDGSACTIGTCNAGYKDCDNKPQNGCETHTDADANNCGACGNVCKPVINGSGGCANGACGVGACSGTFKDCDGQPNNGCEVDTSTDNKNCGACGNACPQGQFCGGGKCGAAAVVGVWGGITWYKVPVAGQMTDPNIYAACKASGFNVPCQTNQGGGCGYNDNLCKQNTPESSCGNPMLGLATAICGTTPPSCGPLNGVYTYMGTHWVGGCGADQGVWCSQGNSVANKFALCIQ